MFAVMGPLTVRWETWKMFAVMGPLTVRRETWKMFAVMGPLTVRWEMFAVMETYSKVGDMEDVCCHGTSCSR